MWHYVIVCVVKPAKKASQPIWAEHSSVPCVWTAIVVATFSFLYSNRTMAAKNGKTYLRHAKYPISQSKMLGNITISHFMSDDFWHRYGAVDLLMKALPLHTAWHIVALFLSNIEWNIILSMISTLRLTTPFSNLRQNSCICIHYQFNMYFVYSFTTTIRNSYHALICVGWLNVGSNEQLSLCALFKLFAVQKLLKLTQIAFRWQKNGGGKQKISKEEKSTRRK